MKFLFSIWAAFLIASSNTEAPNARAQRMADAYRRSPEDVSLLNAILEDTRSVEYWTRHSALAHLRVLVDEDAGKSRELGIPTLAEAINDNHQAIRREGASAFKYLPAREVVRAVDPLITRVKTGVEEDSVWFAVEALGQLGGSNDKILKKAIMCLIIAGEKATPVSDGRPSIRESSMMSLKSLAGEDKDRVRAIVSSALKELYPERLSEYAHQIKAKFQVEQ